MHFKFDKQMFHDGIQLEGYYENAHVEKVTSFIEYSVGTPVLENLVGPIGCLVASQKKQIACFTFIMDFLNIYG